MKILISCLSFRDLTGSELYFYELARELSKEHDVSILSNCGGKLKDALNGVVSFFSFNYPPDSRLDDDTDFDLILSSHTPVTKLVSKLYPDSPIINIIHSEVLPKFEAPVMGGNIKGYIAVRESIKDDLIHRYGIQKPIEVIYNPVDSDRFNKDKRFTDDVGVSNSYILFMGSYDYVRKDAVNDLIDYSKEIGKDLMLVGRDFVDKLKTDEPHVYTFEPTDNPEKMIEHSYMVASVLMGRTVIEGWMCGKNAIIYDINDKYEVVSKSIQPPVDDLTKFKTKNVVKQILGYAKCNIQ